MSESESIDRTVELDKLLTSITSLIRPYIANADAATTKKSSGRSPQVPGDGPRTALTEQHPPHKLTSLLSLDLPREDGGGEAALLALVERLLRYSVNTWDQGFLDKLYAAPSAVGVASELLLGALNTNVHVYGVSPALTVVERETARALAGVFGFRGGFAGGVSQPGGSAANASSLVLARNTLFPETKREGLAGRRFVLFTSAHGHYSLEKAAQIQGFGSNAVRTVPVDGRGRMKVGELERLVKEARDKGETPLYVNATAGTTVLGSYDPFDEIADVCEREGLWLHVDGSWGGPVVFSAKQKHKLTGAHRAGSLTVCPHKMMGVPMTCSFLLVSDLRKLHKAMTLPAGYLFHGAGEDESAVQSAAAATTNGISGDGKPATDDDDPQHVWDLADLTPQCGRRADSLKLALGWVYGGSAGFEARVDSAFEAAAHLAALVRDDPDFDLVSEFPPPCLQVCFYYRKKRAGTDTAAAQSANSRLTETVARRLVPRGFMIDYAPGEEGKFFRVVVNGDTRKETVDGLVKAIAEVGKEVDV